MSYVNQVFGTRKVLKDKCDNADWESLGIKVPSQPSKYVLAKCLNCGYIAPVMIRNLKLTPPKRCVMCSNIGNHNNIKTITNTWAVYDDVAVCNVSYKGQIVSFYIDIDDYESASQRVWRIAKKRQKYYVISGSRKKGTDVYLHGFIFGTVKRGNEIDHIDGNSLNNRRANLREVSRQENIDNQRATRIDNSIGIRGVSENKKAGTYKADFNYHGVRIYTKEWKTVEEAVWCRRCLEDCFELSAIKNNPLAEQYYTLDEKSREKIKAYVHKQILGNERYKSLHACKQLSESQKV